MKKKKKIKIYVGDVILLTNSDGTHDCALILETGGEGIKMLSRSDISTYKTDNFLFDPASVFTLNKDCKN